jgi:hypothetical protein
MENYQTIRQERRERQNRWAAIAALLAVLLVLGVTLGTIVSEQQRRDRATAYLSSDNPAATAGSAQPTNVSRPFSNPDLNKEADVPPPASETTGAAPAR